MARPLVPFVCLGALLLGSQIVSSSTVLPPTFDELVDNASEIFIGQTVSRVSRWVDSREGPFDCDSRDVPNRREPQGRPPNADELGVSRGHCRRDASSRVGRAGIQRRRSGRHLCRESKRRQPGHRVGMAASAYCGIRFGPWTRSASPTVRRSRPQRRSGVSGRRVFKLRRVSRWRLSGKRFSSVWAGPPEHSDDEAHRVSANRRACGGLPRPPKQCAVVCVFGGNMARRLDCDATAAWAF